MIHCKKYLIAACFTLMLPLTVWAEAPVVDESDNFAMMDEQQAYQAPAANPKYDEPIMDSAETNYGSEQDVGPALAKEEPSAQQPRNQLTNNASLIDKIASLQKEVQELRGQLEVQAHDLKELKQQQLTFYKDLDSRISAAGKSAQVAPTNLNVATKTPAPQAVVPTPQPKPVAVTPTTTPTTTTTAAAVTTTPTAVSVNSRMNPADEQIGYLAAYELVKNKRYDDAIASMQNFVHKYPNGGYTANAEYWLGELYLVKKDYSQAINHFEIVLQKFPSSSKSAASMLKAGYAYAATGNNDKAKSNFQQVVRNYPGTPTAQLASKKLETL